MLRTKWLDADDKNVFLHRFDNKTILKRKINGKLYSFVVHLNVGRGTMKRKPDHLSCLKPPFDHNKFNFNKIKREEVLFKIKNTENNIDAIIAINSSPIEFCSSLLIPFPHLCLPQVLTKSSLHLALSIMALSRSRWLRMGYNSAGAAASVNHLHWHLYYLESHLMLEDIEINKNMIHDWPLKAFAFELTNFADKDDIVDKAFRVIDICLEKLIHHNIFITRSKNGTCIRLLIWIRKSIFEPEDNLKINPAFCELSGFFICKSQEQFQALDEDRCIDLIKSVQINLDAYQQFS